MTRIAAHGVSGDVSHVAIECKLAGMLSVSALSGTQPWLRLALVTAVQRPCQDETLSYRIFTMCLILLLGAGLPGAHGNVLKV